MGKPYTLMLETGDRTGPLSKAESDDAYEEKGEAASTLAAHVAAADPHPQYATDADLAANSAADRNRANHTGSQASNTITQATARLLGRTTAGAGTTEELAAAAVKVLLAIAAGDVSGLAAIATSGSASDLGSGSLPAARIANGTITNAMQANAPANTLSGNFTAAAAAPQDQAIAAGQFLGRSSTGNVGPKSITDAAFLALAGLAGYVAPTAFTPTVVGATTAGAGTYSAQQGRYHRIGNIVFFKLYVEITAHTGTGNIRIGGLPIASANDSLDCPVAIGYVGTLTITAGAQLMALVIPNSQQILLWLMPSGGGAATGVAMDTSFGIEISGQYFV